MARPLRIEQIGSWYHVTARGNERREIFRGDRDRWRFIELLEEMVGMFGVRLHVFVLMANHYHLLAEPTELNLSRAVHWLNVSYSVWFNRRHERSGHLFQGRFKSVLVDPEGWGLEVSRYLHLNPVRVGRLGLGKGELQRSRSVGAEKPDPELVRKRTACLRQYRWSSFRAYIGTVKAPAWLTTAAVLKLGGKSRKAPERYREYCEEAIREGLPESPWSQVIGQAVLGSERFVAELSGKLGRTVPERLRRRPAFAEIVGVVEKVYGKKWEEFRDRYGDMGRDLVLYLARRECGMSFGELSARAEIKYPSAAAAVRRFAARAKSNRSIARLLNRAISELNNEQS